MKKWMAVPPTLHPIAKSFEDNPELWKDLLHGSYDVLSDQIPLDIQIRISQAAKRRPIHLDAERELKDAMHLPFTFGEFESCLNALVSGKSPGPSGLTSTQMRHWGPITRKYVFDLSARMWAVHHIPEWWQDRLMTLLPKEQGIHDLNKIRPISLFEIIQKLWARMVTWRIQRIWHCHHVLHPNQHGFRPQHGTHTAILHVLNRLEAAGSDEPLHITLWDIRRAFDSVPKWLQRLAWARLGISPTDLEWFFKLDATGNITVRTPHQQEHTIAATRTEIQNGSPMMHPIGSAFHPERGIGQGDTPSTLIFIAVFDILLTLLDDSGTGEPHAYADDLAHMASTLADQQMQADLVYGFCAFTGLEISVGKVEAISTNHRRILHDTPFLTLHDWTWTPHKVQHSSDGFWTRYLGIFLDKDSCSKHFTKARNNFMLMCHALQKRTAPPEAKKIVYLLCIKSQIRYPAGLAPWTINQYRKLDKAASSLLRHIYGLRRTFPGSLIYAPLEMGGCGETRISDTAQIQKWSYFQSVAHNDHHSTRVVGDFIKRALNETSVSPTYYCTSLLEWVRTIGLEMYPAHRQRMPPAMTSFLLDISRLGPIQMYSDGSFDISQAPLGESLLSSRRELTVQHGRASTGIYIPATPQHPAHAFQLVTPHGQGSDAFYQELLGIAVGALLARTNEVTAYSDCQSAIKRFRQATNHLGAAVGQLQYGQLLLAIRAIQATQSQTITWVKAHPERTKAPDDWDVHDCGIHMADLIAGCGGGPLPTDQAIVFHQCNADDFLNAITPFGTWLWCRDCKPIKESLKQIAGRHHYQQYRNQRDIPESTKISQRDGINTVPPSWRL